MEETTSFIPEIYIGENGNWYIGESDTQVPATGPEGDKGHKGESVLQSMDIQLRLHVRFHCQAESAKIKAVENRGYIQFPIERLNLRDIGDTLFQWSIPMELPFQQQCLVHPDPSVSIVAFVLADDFFHGLSQILILPRAILIGKIFIEALPAAPSIRQ